jgi:hypothetical protein
MTDLHLFEELCEDLIDQAQADPLDQAELRLCLSSCVRKNLFCEKGSCDRHIQCGRKRPWDSFDRRLGRS